MQRINILGVLLASTLLAGCDSIFAKLDHINEPPPMAKMVNPQEKADYKPMTWPMPETPPPEKQYANSLWQPGARAFFRDGRAARVGDILKVTININDKMQFNNQTEGKRTSTDTSTAAGTLGLAHRFFKKAPLLDVPDPANVLNLSGNLDTKGTGTIARQDVITTQVAAMVTQMLPNGNMVIEGKQEITMNKDVREVGIHGVIRPQDIKADNTIDSTQIAEARITYTGRGQLNDMQEPRWGGQVLDAVSPF
jgi:flagellar L-ring protein precursor FlgH